MISALRRIESTPILFEFICGRSVAAQGYERSGIAAHHDSSAISCNPYVPPEASRFLLIAGFTGADCACAALRDTAPITCNARGQHYPASSGNSWRSNVHLGFPKDGRCEGVQRPTAARAGVVPLIAAASTCAARRPAIKDAEAGRQRRAGQNRGHDCMGECRSIRALGSAMAVRGRNFASQLCTVD